MAVEDSGTGDTDRHAGGVRDRQLADPGAQVHRKRRRAGQHLVADLRDQRDADRGGVQPGAPAPRAQLEPDRRGDQRVRQTGQPVVRRHAAGGQ
jgi:hypothetical protein